MANLAENGRCSEGDGGKRAAASLSWGNRDGVGVVVWVKCGLVEFAEEEELEVGDGPGGVDVGGEPLVGTGWWGGGRRLMDAYVILRAGRTHLAWRIF